jgi:hypothetical protein
MKFTIDVKIKTKIITSFEITAESKEKALDLVNNLIKIEVKK